MTQTYLPLNISSVAQQLKTQVIGTKIHYFPKIDSSNTRAAQLAEDGAPAGTLVITDYQTAGRGREKRKWISPPNRNLLFSFVLQPPDSLQSILQITSVTAVALCDAIRKETGLHTVIKWPNDIRVGEKKLCGILTEMKTLKNKVEYVVIGMGINVNTQPEDFPVDLEDSATSIFIETRKIMSREKLLLAIVHSLDKWYLEIIKYGIGGVLSQWKELSDMPGKLVRISNRSQKIEGYVLNLDADGGLLIRKKDGFTEKILSGEIEILM